jgi:hypothetical protein
LVYNYRELDKACFIIYSRLRRVPNFSCWTK